jgi:hypothetical protein
MSITRIGDFDSRTGGFPRITTGDDHPATVSDVLNFAARNAPDAPVTVLIDLATGWVRLSARDGSRLYLNAVID